MNYEKIENFLTELSGDNVHVEEQLDPGEGWTLSYEYPDTYYSGSGWGDHYKEHEMQDMARDTMVGITPLSLISLLLSFNNNPDGIQGEYGIGIDDEVAKALEYYAGRAEPDMTGNKHKWVWVKRVEKQKDKNGYILHCQNTVEPRIKVSIIVGTPGNPTQAPDAMTGAMFVTWSAAGVVAQGIPISNKKAL